MALKFQKKAVIFLAVIVGLALADFLLLHGFVVGRIYRVALRPLSFVTQKTLGAASFTKVFTNASKIGQENKVLREENHKLLAEISNLKEIENENRALRTRLNILPPTGRQFIFAVIFNIRGNEQASGFMIDKGQREGIEEGMAVVSPENILAGVISKVYDQSALVLMPQSKGLAINVSIQGRKVLARSHGNGGDASLEFVTSQDELQKDDVVMTAGFDRIPAAIPVFRVTEVGENGSGLFKQVKVVQIFNILDSNRVFVVK